MPETFLARFPVSVGRRCVGLHSANTENSRRTREKPLIPRVVELYIEGKRKPLGPGCTKCSSHRDARLIERQLEGVKSSRDQLEVSVLRKCPSYRGVRSERVDHMRLNVS